MPHKLNDPRQLLKVARALLDICTAAAFVVVAIAPAQAATGKPTLVSESASTRAVALETITQKREPFTSTPTVDFSSDHHTRIMIFAFNLYKFADDGVDAYKVDAEDLNHRHYALPVEFAGPVPGFEGITQLNVRLTDELGDVGDVLLSLSLHGITTNRVRVGIGHIGGGPLDDAGAVPTPAPALPPPAIPTLNRYVGPASSADTVRLLEQASFGPTQAEVARVQSLGFRAYLNEQFAAPASSYPTMPLQPLDDTVGCPDSLTRNACLRDNYTMYRLQRRFFTNAFYGSDQLRQRVAFALHQILVVSGRDVTQPSWMTAYLQTLDRNAFGNYRQLLYEITLNPAMGSYLNLEGNSKVSPNENYAREVLQLFSVGQDQLNLDGTPRLDAQGKPLATYDQATITNFARVFTGWTYAAQPAPGIVNYLDPLVPSNNANVHDTNQKTLLNGAVLPAGLTTQQDLNAALDNIFSHPNVAPYISLRLIRSLVTSNPSPGYVARVAVAFNNNCAGLYADDVCSGERGDLKAVVRAILLDPEARGDVKTDPNYGKLREPALFMIGFMRAFHPHGAAVVNGGVVAVASDGVLNPQAADLGQDIFQPVTVFGYFPADYGIAGTDLKAPEFGGLSSATSLKRINFVTLMVYSGIYFAVSIDIPNGTTLGSDPFFPLANNPEQLVALFDSLFLHGTMTVTMRDAIVQALLTIPAVGPGENYLRDRTHLAMFLVLSSQQYQVQR